MQPSPGRQQASDKMTGSNPMSPGTSGDVSPFDLSGDMGDAAPGSPLSDTADGSLQDSLSGPKWDSHAEMAEQAKHEADIENRIAELRKEGFWTPRRLAKVPEPSRPKVQWDYLCEEMQWLSADFGQERRWKRGVARKVVRMVVRHHEELKQKEERARREEQAKLRRIASTVAKEVRQFWSNVEKVVQFKQQSRLEEKRKKALDLQLDFIVGQTEKYSDLLSQSLSETLPASKTSSSCIGSSRGGSLGTSPVPSVCPREDEDFMPHEEDDDEETIEIEERQDGHDAESHRLEIEMLKRESEVPIEELLQSLPPEIAQKPLPNHWIHEVDEDDDEFTANEDEAEDEEETIAAEEELEGQQDHSEELSELTREGEMSLEELLKKYSGQGPVQLDDSEDNALSDQGTGSSDCGSSDSESEGVELLLKPKDESETPQHPEPKKEITDIAATAESLQPKGYTLATTQVKTAVPFLLRGELREYQHIGLEWMVTMYEKKLNGILADEMGLGKTIQTISLLAHLACEQGNWGPHLIIVPTSVILNWEMELKRWCPSFKILTYYGSQKERRLKRQGWTKVNAFHVCITSYKLVLQDHQAFRRKNWKYLILDEAQNIKNFKSQRWQSLLNFNSQRRLLLTGTPLQNSLMELWSLMHFLMPHVFQSHREFKEWFSNPLTGMIEGSQEYNEGLIRRLHKVLRPFLLRRIKVDVEKQMPKKYEHVIYCRLSKRQRFLYDDFMAQAATRDTLASGHFMSVINILMQLRKVCNHPNLFDPRPIHSPFITSEICYSVPSLVLHALERHPLQRVDTAKFDLINMETRTSRYESEVFLPQYKPSHSLIQEIADSPDPPPRPRPLKMKVNRMLQPVAKPDPRTLVVVNNSRPIQKPPDQPPLSSPPPMPSGPLAQAPPNPISPGLVGSVQQMVQTQVPPVVQSSPGMGSVAPLTTGMVKPVAVSTAQPGNSTPQRLILTPDMQARLPSGEVITLSQFASLGRPLQAPAGTKPLTVQLHGAKLTLSSPQVRQLGVGQARPLQGNVLHLVTSGGQHHLLSQPAQLALIQALAQQAAAPAQSATPALVQSSGQAQLGVQTVSLQSVPHTLLAGANLPTTALTGQAPGVVKIVVRQAARETLTPSPRPSQTQNPPRPVLRVLPGSLPENGGSRTGQGERTVTAVTTSSIAASPLLMVSSPTLTSKPPASNSVASLHNHSVGLNTEGQSAVSSVALRLLTSGTPATLQMTNHHSSPRPTQSLASASSASCPGQTPGLVNCPPCQSVTPDSNTCTIPQKISTTDVNPNQTGGQSSYTVSNGNGFGQTTIFLPQNSTVQERHESVLPQTPQPLSCLSTSGPSSDHAHLVSLNSSPVSSPKLTASGYNFSLVPALLSNSSPCTVSSYNPVPARFLTSPVSLLTLSPLTSTNSNAAPILYTHPSALSSLSASTTSQAIPLSTVQASVALPPHSLPQPSLPASVTLASPTSVSLPLLPTPPANTFTALASAPLTSSVAALTARASASTASIMLAASSASAPLSSVTLAAPASVATPSAVLSAPTSTSEFVAPTPAPVAALTASSSGTMTSIMVAATSTSTPLTPMAIATPGPAVAHIDVPPTTSLVPLIETAAPQPMLAASTSDCVPTVTAPSPAHRPLRTGPASTSLPLAVIASPTSSPVAALAALTPTVDTTLATLGAPVSAPLAVLASPAPLQTLPGSISVPFSLLAASVSETLPSLVLSTQLPFATTSVTEPAPTPSSSTSLLPSRSAPASLPLIIGSDNISLPSSVTLPFLSTSLPLSTSVPVLAAKSRLNTTLAPQAAAAASPVLQAAAASPVLHATAAASLPVPQAAAAAASLPVPQAAATTALLPLPVPQAAATTALLPLPVPQAATAPLPLPVPQTATAPLPLPVPQAATAPLPLPVPQAATAPLPLPVPQAANAPLPLPVPQAATAPLPLPVPQAASATAPLPVPQAATAPLPVPQAATAPLPVPQAATAPLPVPQAATAPLPVPQAATAPLPVPQAATTAPLPAPQAATAPLPVPQAATAPLPVPQAATAPFPVPQAATTAPLPVPQAAATAPLPVPQAAATAPLPVPQAAATAPLPVPQAAATAPLPVPQAAATAPLPVPQAAATAPLPVPQAAATAPLPAPQAAATAPLPVPQAAATAPLPAPQAAATAPLPAPQAAATAPLPAPQAAATAPLPAPQAAATAPLPAPQAAATAPLPAPQAAATAPLPAPQAAATAPLPAPQAAATAPLPAPQAAATAPLPAPQAAATAPLPAPQAAATAPLPAPQAAATAPLPAPQAAATAPLPARQAAAPLPARQAAATTSFPPPVPLAAATAPLSPQAAPRSVPSTAMATVPLMAAAATVPLAAPPLPISQAVATAASLFPVPLAAAPSFPVLEGVGATAPSFPIPQAISAATPHTVAQAVVPQVSGLPLFPSVSLNSLASPSVNPSLASCTRWAASNMPCLTTASTHQPFVISPNQASVSTHVQASSEQISIPLLPSQSSSLVTTLPFPVTKLQCTPMTTSTISASSVAPSHVAHASSSLQLSSIPSSSAPVSSLSFCVATSVSTTLSNVIAPVSDSPQPLAATSAAMSAPEPTLSLSVASPPSVCVPLNTMDSDMLLDGDVSRSTPTTVVSVRPRRQPPPPPRSPFYLEPLEERRRRHKVERLERNFRLNEERCGLSPVYGAEILRFCTLPDKRVLSADSGSLPQHMHDYWLHTSSLRNCIFTPHQRLKQLGQLIERFIFAMPPVEAPRITLHTSHPPPSLLLQESLFKETLSRDLMPRTSCLHRIISNMRTQFPDLRLIQYDCGKLQTMDRLLRELKSGGHRVLIFTQMTRMLDILEQFLNYHGHIYLRLDGSTRVEQRQVLMERFNMDKRIFCFILSTRSGGVGVNLTGADTVIFYDSDWNPTMDAQAQDRCHRIGQTRDVHIYRLVSERTVEENILKKAQQKRMLGDMAIEGGNFTTAYFKQQTIRELFDMEDVTRRDMETRAASPDRSAEDGGASRHTHILEQALCGAEDEEDTLAASLVRAEQVADLAEFNENAPLEQEEEEPSRAEQEISALVQQLTPIERYAMYYLEASMEDVSREELKQAEEQVEAARKDLFLAKDDGVQSAEERWEEECKKIRKSRALPAARPQGERMAVRMSERLRGGRATEGTDFGHPAMPEIVTPRPETVSPTEEVVAAPHPETVSPTEEVVAAPHPETVSPTEEVVAAPHPETVSPTEEVVAAPRPETVSLAEEVVAPRPETVSPAEEVVAPRPETVSPAEEVVAPRPETVSPAEEVVAPRPETVSPAEEVVAPRPETVSPAEEVVAPRPETVSPAEEVVAPCPETVSPAEEVVAQRPETVSLAEEVVAPHLDTVSSAEEIVAPCPETVSPAEETVNPVGEKVEGMRSLHDLHSPPVTDLAEPERAVKSEDDSRVMEEPSSSPPVPAAPPQQDIVEHRVFLSAQECEAEVVQEEEKLILPKLESFLSSPSICVSQEEESSVPRTPRRKVTADCEILLAGSGDGSPTAKVLRRLPGRLVTVVQDRPPVNRRSRGRRLRPSAEQGARSPHTPEPQSPTHGLLSDANSDAGSPPPKRKRGRPPKTRADQSPIGVSLDISQVVSSPELSNSPTGARMPGSPNSCSRLNSESESGSPIEKRKRGRPPKRRESTVTESSDLHSPSDTTEDNPTSHTSDSRLCVKADPELVASVTCDRSADLVIPSAASDIPQVAICGEGEGSGGFRGGMEDLSSPPKRKRGRPPKSQAVSKSVSSPSLHNDRADSSPERSSSPYTARTPFRRKKPSKSVTLEEQRLSSRPADTDDSSGGEDVPIRTPFTRSVSTRLQPNQGQLETTPASVLASKRSHGLSLRIAPVLEKPSGKKRKPASVSSPSPPSSPHGSSSERQVTGARKRPCPPAERILRSSLTANPASNTRSSRPMPPLATSPSSHRGRKAKT